MKYEENYTELRNLNSGDEFIDKGNCEGVYVKALGNDEHLLKDGRGNEYKVPHGRFPVFKKIKEL